VKTFQSTYTVDLNQHVNVTNWDLQLISKGNQKKLRQTLNLDLDYKSAFPNDVEKCYKVLTENRAMLGVSVSMSLDELLLALKQFPEIYRMNYIQLKDEVVAMCFTVDIAPHVRYVLYWADNLKFRNLSPTVLLCTKLIESAKKDQIEILDLGISSLNGHINQGLHRFKKNLGAIDSSKPSFNLLFQD
jgi:lipid II:glycine glycyltransferase (peptidoglycan interpeptide bridge formation enzyme)